MRLLCFLILCAIIAVFFITALHTGDTTRAVSQAKQRCGNKTLHLKRGEHRVIFRCGNSDKKHVIKY